MQCRGFDLSWTEMASRGLNGMKDWLGVVKRDGIWKDGTTFFSGFIWCGREVPLHDNFARKKRKSRDGNACEIYCPRRKGTVHIEVRWYQMNAKTLSRTGLHWQGAGLPTDGLPIDAVAWSIHSSDWSAFGLASRYFVTLLQLVYKKKSGDYLIGVFLLWYSFVPIF